MVTPPGVCASAWCASSFTSHQSGGKQAFQPRRQGVSGLIHGSQSKPRRVGEIRRHQRPAFGDHLPAASRAHRAAQARRRSYQLALVACVNYPPLDAAGKKKRGCPTFGTSSSWFADAPCVHASPQAFVFGLFQPYIFPVVWRGPAPRQGCCQRRSCPGQGAYDSSDIPIPGRPASGRHGGSRTSGTSG
jgi:hypothetical protein